MKTAGQRTSFFFISTATILAAFFAALLSPLAFAQQQLTRSDGSDIHYYLIADSERATTDSLVLVLQGSDCRSVAPRLKEYREFGDIAPGADFLMIEKYGLTADLESDESAQTFDENTSCPDTYLQNDRPSQRQADALQVLNQLKKTYPRIIVMGGSEGAVIAARICAVYPASACILVYGGGRWFENDVIHNIRVTETENIDEQVAGFQGFSEYIRNNPDAEAIVSGHGPAWWRESLSLDFQQLIASIDVPLLILQSDEDTQVNVDEAISMAETLQTSGHSHIEFQRLPGLDHILRDAEGVSHKSDVISRMASWLGSVSVK